MEHSIWNGDGSFQWAPRPSRSTEACLRVENTACSCCGAWSCDVKCTVQSIICRVPADGGMERALTQSSLSPLPSMDYLWAGDDCCAGLQSRWLGSGKFFSFFVGVSSSRSGASKAIARSLAAIPTLQQAPLPNVKIRFFLFGQMVLLCL